MGGRGRRKDREGEGPLKDLVTLKEAERRAGAEGGATRATEGWGGEGRPRDGDRRRALGVSLGTNKRTWRGAVGSGAISGGCLYLWHTCLHWGLPVCVPGSPGAAGVGVDGRPVNHSRSEPAEWPHT